jgi:competence protein ComEC
LRRPIVFILLAFALGIFIGYKSFLCIILIALFSAIIFIVFGKFPNTIFKSDYSYNLLETINFKWLYIFISLLILGALLLQYHSRVDERIEKLVGENIIVIGEVMTVVEKGKEYSQLEMKVKLIENGKYEIKTKEKILIKIFGPFSSISNINDERAIQNLVGKVIEINGKLLMPPGIKNPKLFNYSEFLKTKGINFILETNTYSCKLIDGKTNYFINILSNFKYQFSKRLEKIIPAESYALFLGILLGDTNMMEEDIYDLFQKNGTAHILSVSGIHVAIIYACIEKLIPNKNSIPYNVLIIFILFCYSALSLFSPSVMRAVFMITVYIVAKLINEKYDLTTCTAFTGLILLIYNPFYLFSLGFQLSYLAVFVLAILLPYIDIKLQENGLGEVQGEKEKISHKDWRKIGKKVFYYMLPLVAIQMGMVPITAYVFNYFSLSAFITNAPVIIISSALLPIGLFMMALEIVDKLIELLSNTLTNSNIINELFNYLNFVNDMFFNIAGYASQLLIEIMIWINKIMAVKGAGYFYCESPSIIIVVLYYFLLFIICCELGQYLISKQYANILSGNSNDFVSIKSLNASQRLLTLNFSAIGLILIILIIILMPNSKYQDAEITFVDVGQGDCIHITTPEGKNILIDGGGTRPIEVGQDSYDVGGKILFPYLLKNKVGRIDLAIVTHLHDDHFAGIASLSKLIEIDKLVVYKGNIGKENEILDKVNIEKEDLAYVDFPDRILIANGIFIDVLYPKLDDTQNLEMKDENEMNLLLKLNYKGVTTLITGDLTGVDESKIIGEDINLKSDIIKIAHHGSKYSSTQEFLKKVDPEIAIIQVGKNSFGHPSQAVIDECEKNNIEIFRTDKDGAILFDIEEGMIQNVLTMKENSWHKFVGRKDEQL